GTSEPIGAAHPTSQAPTPGTAQPAGEAPTTGAAQPTSDAKKTVQAASAPPNTKSLTPQQVAKLYNFPSGTGAGQTIGIYEMPTSEGAPGYSPTDISATIQAFGGSLKV